MPPTSTPPTPPPLTPLTATPTTVPAKLPQETVNHLAPPPHSLCDWLYTNGATLLAAAAAIFAACIAYNAVKKQITANKDAVDDQIKNNQKGIADQIAAQDRRRQEVMRAEIVIEANELAYHVHAWATKRKDRPSRHVLSRTSKDVRYEEDSLGKRVEILGLKLRLFDMREQNDALIRYWNQAKERPKSNTDSPDIELLYNQLLGHLKKVVPAIEAGKPVGN